MSIDAFIVVSFLILTLVVGLKYGKKVKTLQDYALGGRKFSTIALVATIVATQASGSMFFTTLTQTYKDGFYFLFSSFGVGLSISLTAIILIPRMGKFLGKISIAEAMGDVYGKKVRFITAIAGTIGSSGLIAVQFKVFGGILSYFLSMPSYLTIVVGGLVTTVYSTFGGIRSVTFTDVLQGFTFGVIIPLLGFAIWNQFYYMGYSLDSAFYDNKFNIKLLFDISSDNFWNCIFLFILVSIPAISVPTFQRISMGSNIAQIKKAFIIAGSILIVIQIAIVWIPFLLHKINPTLESNKLLSYIVDTYSFAGLKGLILIAIIAFTMSTADSYINSSAVLFTHDIYGLLSKNKKIDSLLIAKLFTGALGCFAIVLSLIETDLLGIIIFANSFYFPVVTPPFLLTIFGFRNNTKSVLIGMSIAVVVTTLWKLLPSNFLPLSQNIIGFLFAMFCNAFFLITNHYLLLQQGGLVEIKNSEFRKEKKTTNWIQEFLKFRNKVYLNNSLNKLAPHNDVTYTALGVYFIICTITTMYSTQIELLGRNAQLMKIIYPLMLVTGTSIALYPIWPLSISNGIKKVIIQIWYPISIFYMLIFFSFFFVLVSKFAMLPVALLMMNLMIASLLLGWRLILPSMIIGLYGSIKIYKNFFVIDNFVVQFNSPEFILLYLLLITSIVLFLFLKPKEEHYNLTEQKSDYLSNKLINQTVELKKSLELKQEFLRNLEHEARTPITSISTMGSILDESYDKLSEKQRRKAIKDIAKSSERLNSLISNILDLSKLSGLNYQLNITDIDFSELVYERVKICRKLYTEDKYKDLQEVTIDISDDIIVSCDKNYITTAIDNIVINALQYCTDGKITIILYENEQKEVVFKVQDEGIGIPKEELYDVFGAFAVSSKTKTPAGGRGVGLALSKKVVDLHNGRIWAKQNSDKGVTVGFNLPLKNVDI